MLRKLFCCCCRGNDDEDAGGPSNDVFNLTERKCTDVLFLLVFIAFWGGMFTVAGFGFDNGDPARLIRPRDYRKMICGENYNATFGNYKEKPFLFFPVLDKDTVGGTNPSTNFLPLQGADQSQANYNTRATIRRDFSVCVGQCPTSAVLESAGEQDPYRSAVKYPTYPSKSFLKRCVPFNTTTETIELTYATVSDGTQTLGLDAVKGFVSQILNAVEYIRDALDEVDTNKWWILASAGVAALVGFAVLILMRFFGGLLVWLSIIFAILSLAAVSVVFLIKAGKIDGSQLGSEDLGVDVDIDVEDDNQKVMYAFGSFFGAITVVIVVLVVFLHGRIRVANKCIEYAAKAVIDMPMILFYPLFTLLLLIVFFGYWVMVALFLASSGDLKEPTGTVPPNIQGGFTYDDTLKKMLIYHFFGLLWIKAFLYAMNELVVSGAIASHYFLNDTSAMPSMPVLASFKRSWRYHTGTAAFGSFIIALIQFIRAVFNYFANKARANKDNKIVKALICCVNYCLWCFERFMEFLNEQAYIQTAIHGHSFCQAARRAFKLLLENILRVTAITMVSNFVLFIMKIAVSFLSVAITLYLLANHREIAMNEVPVFPALLMIVLSYAVAAVFMAVYDNAIDTVFQCYVEDDRKASKGLKKFMDSAGDEDDL